MIDFELLQRLVEAHEEVVRLVVADAKGSTPREIGVDMVVWKDGLHQTIGGGRMEYDAIKRARRLLTEDRDQLIERQALGPGLGQCCGGSITIVFERFDAERLAAARKAAGKTGVFLRQVGPGMQSPPKALLTPHSNEPLSFRRGWLAEPVWRARLPVYIYGAGHVGRALALALEPLPQFEVHLVDVRRDQFADLPESIHQTWEILPTDVLATAPDEAAHFIMTPEHDYDLELCHRLLSRSFGYAGLIGSETKWARFRARLIALGHAPKQIARITCPIGDKSLGKHPQEIAVGVVLNLLHYAAQRTNTEASPT
ncbi:xanthine dehydrogenase accessory protein XdhC [Roseovarius faecimaris]|uniref:Xanthine dehydrogenase accessory protein XdhC n=1 Tax=Roseovarius faecimaris TaxID=2494550 RepID=A0A6I6IRF6_9RHOB|nr:xanthine dehydrogenase accessory protein XdhC [Roseovarius faecimaris]QGX99720.1 xanthine dehydrogenase accessory protein XdhC [Roseovarius faecimaris]